MTTNLSESLLCPFHRRSSAARASLCAFALALSAAAPAAAASPPAAGEDPDPLDMFLDRAAGEPLTRDAELGALAVGVEASLRLTSDGTSTFGAFAFLQVPLERLGKRRRAAASALAEAPRSPAASPPQPAPLAPATAAEPPPEAAPRPVLMTAELARGAVRAACKHARLDDADARLDGLSSRARTSALLPELRLRATRMIDESESVAPTEYDPLRRTASGGTSTWLEARATFRLDRLVFADDEIALERLRTERVAERARLVAKVLDLLDAWQRARATEQDPDAKPEAQLRAMLGAAASAAALDVLTDGWFSKALPRATGALPDSDGKATAAASTAPQSEARKPTGQEATPGDSRASASHPRTPAGKE